MDINDYWNGWKIAGLLGEGTFGTVYRIEKEEFGHVYSSALKVVRVPRSDAEMRAIQNEGMDEKSMTMYFNSVVENIVSELALMSKLRGNSNIVSYEDHKVVKLEDTFGWDVFIKMELLTPLYDHINNTETTVKDVVKLGIDICKALELCSKYSIIHRDIKPENIFYSEHGDFKLGDFGIARELEKTMAGLTRTGTPAYMAPEVYKGLPYNSTVDTYSLGVVLYRLLNNNRTPFLPDYPSTITYSDRQNANIKRLSGEIPPFPCNADNELGRIILKACAYDPKDRFKSAEDMRKALEGYSCPGDNGKVLFPLKEEVKDIDEQESSREADTTAETVSLDERLTADSNKDTNGEDLSMSDSDDLRMPFRRRKPKVLIIAGIIGLVLVLIPMVYKYYHHTVPNLVDLHSDAAVLAVEHAGLKYNEKDRVFSDTVARGVIISQSKDSGEQVKRGTVIDVVVSKGAPIKLPDVTGKRKATAEKLLADKRLVLKVEKREYSDKVKKGRVIRQDPEPGTECEETQVINVVISKGVELVEVPDVVGMTCEKAEEMLKAAGLKVEIESVYSSIAAGNVIAQSEQAGDKIAKNTTVLLSVSVGQSTYRKPSGSRNNGGNSSSATEENSTQSDNDEKKEEEKDSDINQGDDNKESTEGGQIINQGDNGNQGKEQTNIEE